MVESNFKSDKSVVEQISHNHASGRTAAWQTRSGHIGPMHVATVAINNGVWLEVTHVFYLENLWSGEIYLFV